GRGQLERRPGPNREWERAQTAGEDAARVGRDSGREEQAAVDGIEPVGDSPAPSVSARACGDRAGHAPLLVGVREQVRRAWRALRFETRFRGRRGKDAHVGDDRQLFLIEQIPQSAACRMKAEGRPATCRLDGEQLRLRDVEAGRRRANASVCLVAGRVEAYESVLAIVAACLEYTNQR